MKKQMIIAVVVVLGLVGGVVTKLAIDNAKDKKQDTIATMSPSQTVEPTAEPVKTEEATSTPEGTIEPTATPAEETMAPEVDYSKLSDVELIKQMVDGITKRHADIKKMTDKERVVYSVSSYTNSMQKGLYAYLTGNENVTAQYLSKALEAVNAKDAKVLFNDFIDSFHIDVAKTKELSKIKQDDYNFEVYDDEYKQLIKDENLDSLLAAYIKSNLEDLK